MTTFKTFLVPVDGSDKALRAVDRAVDLVGPLNGKIVLFYVLDLMRTMEYGESMPPLVTGEGGMLASYPGVTTVETDRAENPRKYHAESVLMEAKKRIPEGIEVFAHYIAGSPKYEILSMAKSTHADMIIMGNRGIGSILGVVLGSVSLYIVSNAECPVLIVP